MKSHVHTSPPGTESETSALYNYIVNAAYRLFPDTALHFGTGRMHFDQFIKVAGPKKRGKKSLSQKDSQY